MSAFDEFRTPGASNFELKLTFLGIQREVVTTVMVVESGDALSLGRFFPFRRADVNYHNDDLTTPDGAPGLMSFSATAAEIRALIDAVGTVPQATSSDRLPDRFFLSYMMVAVKEGVDIAFESLLGGPESWRILTAMEAALPTDHVGRGILHAELLAVCGNLDDDNDGIQNRCDQCPIAGPAGSGGCPGCNGDCDGSNAVTIDEILRGVNIGLGTRPIQDCRSFDQNWDYTVTVDEVLGAVARALQGCG